VTESLIEFLKSHPFWAILIILFMALPIVGAFLHILLKAFGRRGIDNLPTLPETPPNDRGSNGLPEEKSGGDENTQAKK
jgi:hypothetical protein